MENLAIYTNDICHFADMSMWIINLKSLSNHCADLQYFLNCALVRTTPIAALRSKP